MIQDHYQALKARNLSINASRGRPHTSQVDLCSGMLSSLETHFSEDGADVRNYGGLDGIPEMKRIFAQILDVSPQNIIVGGNSSISMMFDCIAALIHKGIWAAGQKFLCPSPGYDKHFAICEYFGLKMLSVPMTLTGPDMDVTEALAKDPDVAGMWCVPVFSNPQGYIYSDETIRRLASMPTAHPSFRLLWDDAYSVHNFRGTRPKIANILHECTNCGNAARPLLFTSFSKISTPGAGVVCMAADENELKIFRERINIQTIGPDKINQLRHAHFFKDLSGVLAHMKKHANILRPKFERAYEVLETGLAGTGASFIQSDGGYFISIDTPPGCAKKVWQLCKEAGVLLTDAGATYPYGNDPLDTNLRLAPTGLSIDEIEQALEVLIVAVKLAVLK